jgi:hypothetical protein
MKEKEKNDLLAKLIDGSISHADYRRLEVAALDDPFLFDALEGYVVNMPIDKRQIEHVLTRVNDDIIKKDKENIFSTFNTRKLYLIMGSIAASLALLFIFLNFMKQDKGNDSKMATELAKPSTSISNDEGKEEVAQSLPSKKEDETIETKGLVSTSSKEKALITDAKNIASTNDDDGTKDGKELIKEEENLNSISEVLAVESKDDKRREIEREEAPPRVDASISASPVSTKYKAAPKQSKSKNTFHLSGKITNAQGDAISNVHIITQENDAISGVDGTFDIDLSKGDHFAVIAHKDYDTQGMHFMKQDELAIILKDNSYDEQGIQVNNGGNFELFSSKIRNQLLRFLKTNNMTLSNPINTYFMVNKDGSISDIIVLGAFNFELQSQIETWIKENKNFLPTSGRGEVLDMEFKEE